MASDCASTCIEKIVAKVEPFQRAPQSLRDQMQQMLTMVAMMRGDEYVYDLTDDLLVAYQLHCDGKTEKAFQLMEPYGLTREMYDSMLAQLSAN